ncbi:MAG: hypothetical protein RQM89_11840 [Acetomicrobium sp.]
MGAAKTGAEIVKILKNTKALGIKPVAILDDGVEKHGKLIEGVTVMGSLELAPHLAKQCNIRWAIMAMPGLDRERLLQIWEENASYFHHVIYIPGPFWLCKPWRLAEGFWRHIGLGGAPAAFALKPQNCQGHCGCDRSGSCPCGFGTSYTFYSTVYKARFKGPCVLQANEIR